MRTGWQAVGFSGLRLNLACRRDASITENYF